MGIEQYFMGHPALNFLAYLFFCVCAWGVSLWTYEKLTPYREWELLGAGNMAASYAISGVALGLALPLGSLAAHSDGWVDFLFWAVLSLAVQLGLWVVLNKALGSSLRSKVEQGVASVGAFLGSCAFGLGVLVACCVS